MCSVSAWVSPAVHSIGTWHLWPLLCTGQVWIRARQKQGCLWRRHWTDCTLSLRWDEGCKPPGIRACGICWEASREKDASRENQRQGTPRLWRCYVINLLWDWYLLRQSPVREICPHAYWQMLHSCIVREGAFPKQEGFCTVGHHAWVPLLLPVPSTEGGHRYLIRGIWGRTGICCSVPQSHSPPTGAAACFPTTHSPLPAWSAVSSYPPVPASLFLPKSTGEMLSKQIRPHSASKSPPAKVQISAAFSL